MSSGASAMTLVFEPRASRWLATGVVLAYAAAAVGLVVALPSPWHLFAPVLAAAGAAFDLRRLARLPRLWWSGDGSWRRGDPEGPAWRLGAATWSTPWLILLVLHGPGGTVRVPLARDALDPVTWRRLRARLRVEGAAATGLEGGA